MAEGGARLWALCVLVVFLSCTSISQAQDFSFEDVHGDVYVQPPTNVAKVTAFDLLSLTIETRTTAPFETTVSFEMADVIPSRSLPCGFDGPLFVLLWHQMAGGSWRVVKVGSQEAPLNSNILLDPQFSWQLMMTVSPQGAKLYSPVSETTIDLTDSCSSDGDVISVSFETRFLTSLGASDPNYKPLDHTSWRFTALVGAYDEDADQFMKVGAKSSSNVLGGGDDSGYGPNIVDILIAEDQDQTKRQLQMLRNYCASSQALSIISTVGTSNLLFAPYGNTISTLNSAHLMQSGGAGCLDSVNDALSSNGRYTATSQRIDNDIGYQTLDLFFKPSGADQLAHLGPDSSRLEVMVLRIDENILRVRINDAINERWQTPSLIDKRLAERGIKTTTEKDANYQFYNTRSPSGFSLVRKSNAEVLFNSTPPATGPSFRDLVFKKKYLEISTQLPSDADLYGLGERVFDLKLARDNQAFNFWNFDQGNPWKKNLYGTHPFYMDVRPNGLAHGVLLLNNHGLEVQLTQNSLTYRLMGGVLDFFFFLGPDPDSVLSQYQSIVGTPTLTPYWSLGFHQCRWGYKNINDLQTVVDQYKKNQLPLDTMWSDIDYMDQKKLFTLDPVNYPADKMGNFVKSLHSSNQHYVMIVDPGVRIEKGYEPYEDGITRDIFVKNADNSAIQVAKVWPGPVAFPDWIHPEVSDYWTSHLRQFHDQVPYDGLWLDMNEVANFCDGHCVLDVDYEEDWEELFSCPCHNQTITEYDYPPMWPAAGMSAEYSRMPPGSSTISMSSTHYGNQKEYDMHNIFGHLESIHSRNALLDIIPNKRPFIITRSTFTGTGHYAGHWLGDNYASWDDMRNSIQGIISMNMFGLPMVGADICGFAGNTTVELCARWMQLGAFYPFSRNHNEIGATSQEPYSLGQTVLDISRSALQLRYRLIPFFYSQLFQVSLSSGAAVRPLFYDSPLDPQCRSIRDQFLWGRDLMVAPVLKPQATNLQVYFPAGVWFDFYTGHKTHANTTIGAWHSLNVTLESVPLFLRGGSIIPIQQTSNALTTTDAKLTSLNVLVGLVNNAGSTSSGFFYLDDGESTNFHQKHSRWNFHANYSGSGYFEIVCPFYNFTAPEQMMWGNVTIYGVLGPSTVVQVNGKSVKNYVYDADHHSLTVPLGIKLGKSAIQVKWNTNYDDQTGFQKFCIVLLGLGVGLSLLAFTTFVLFLIWRRFFSPYVQSIPFPIEDGADPM